MSKKGENAVRVEEKRKGIKKERGWGILGGSQRQKNSGGIYIL